MPALAETKAEKAPLRALGVAFLDSTVTWNSTVPPSVSGSAVTWVTVPTGLPALESLLWQFRHDEARLYTAVEVRAWAVTAPRTTTTSTTTLVIGIPALATNGS
jgi:hypothetical protein